jgi:hypothetical protein
MVLSSASSLVTLGNQASLINTQTTNGPDSASSFS